MIILLLWACGHPPTPPADPTFAVTGWETLAGMDHRQPVPMPAMMALHQKKQMRGHLVVVQEVLAGLAADDLAAVEAAAMRMGTSPEMSTMCERMGAEAEGFTDEALAFHRRADAIAAAARAGDRAGVVAATADTVQACTACHERFRQEVR
ncbi:MAG: cytochrome c [Alphaproteobacteria bacterium]|nr:cytochrome c [Alphaproteobacteria bacterium]